MPESENAIRTPVNQAATITNKVSLVISSSQCHPGRFNFIAFRRTGSSKRHTKSLLSPAPGGLLQFMMRLPRRVPWGSLQELDQVCAWIYTDENDIDAKIHAANRASNFFIPTR